MKHNKYLYILLIFLIGFNSPLLAISDEAKAVLEKIRINHQKNEGRVETTNEQGETSNEAVPEDIFIMIMMNSDTLEEQLKNHIRLFPESVRLTTYKDSTPLHIAAQWCEPRIVKLLIEHGANVNAAEDAGRTPLEIADKKNVKLLESAGAKMGKFELPKIPFTAVNSLMEPYSENEDYIPLTPIEKVAHIVAGAKDNGGDWHIKYGVSVMDDQETITCYLEAENSVVSNYDNVRPMLVLTYKEGCFSAYISYGIFINTEHQILTIRFDKEQPQNLAFRVSTDYKAVFAPSALQFFEYLANASYMAVRTTPYSRSPITSTFNLRGSKYAISKIMQTHQKYNPK